MKVTWLAHAYSFSKFIEWIFPFLYYQHHKFCPSSGRVHTFTTLCVWYTRFYFFDTRFRLSIVWVCPHVDHITCVCLVYPFLHTTSVANYCLPFVWVSVCWCASSITVFIPPATQDFACLSSGRPHVDHICVCPVYPFLHTTPVLSHIFAGLSFGVCMWMCI